MLSILHLADLHLGASFSFLPPDKAKRASQLQFTALEHAINYAANQSANAVLIAGDLFDQHSPSPEIVSQAFSILSHSKCPVLISPGNHDYISASSPYLNSRIPDCVHIFTSPTLTAFPISDNAIIWGAAFCGQGAEILPSAELNHNNTNILLLHSDLKSKSIYNPLTSSDIRKSGFDYAAFGHNHEYSGMHRSGNTIYACSGSLSCVGADDAGKKGFLFGTFSNDVKFRFIPSEGMEYHKISIDFSELANDKMLQDALLPLIPRNRSKVCAQIELCGEKHYEPNVTALKNVLSRTFFNAEICDNTISSGSIWSYLNDDDLRGHVSRKYQKLIEQASSEHERSALNLSFRYALAALNGDAQPSSIMQRN